MNKGCTIAIVAVFILGILLSVGISLLSGANDYVRIVGQNYSAVVETDGSITVTEKLTFDIHAAKNTDDGQMWELWRDLPEYDIDGLKVRYEVASVKKLKSDGTVDTNFNKAPRIIYQDDSWAFWKANKNTWWHSVGPYDKYKSENTDYYDNWECVIIYPGGVYREIQTYEIVYKMKNAAIQYGDCTELYITLFGDADGYKDIKYLKSVKGEIKIADAQMPAEGNYDAHTYGTNSHEFDIAKTKSGGYTTFSFELNEKQLKFKPYNQYIEFSLVAHGNDKYKLAPEASSLNKGWNVYEDILKEQKAYEKLPAKYLTIKIVVFIVLAGLAAFIIWFVIKQDEKRRKKLFKPEIPFEKYREIPSNLDVSMAGSLVFCKHKISDDVPGVYAAALLGLIRKRYIYTEKVQQDKSWENPSNVNLKISADFTDGKAPLTPTEESYYNLIRRHAPNGDITVAKLQSKIGSDYQYTNTFVGNTKNMMMTQGVSSGYTQKPDYKEPKRTMMQGSLKFFIPGVLIMVIANLVSAQTRIDLAFGAYFLFGGCFIAAGMLYLLFSRNYVLLTQFGQDEYAKWRGLYNFMQDETLMKEQTVDKIEAWEEYLIYATAFGIPDKVLKALNAKFPNYNIQNSLIISHPFLCTALFVRHTNRTMRMSAGRAVTASRMSGSGGHGGYGGGGRGGGGGGGGH